MCGIFGVIWHNTDHVPEQSRLDQTVRLLNHRGPDGHGTFSEPGIGLAHTRLSLLDLNERSNQPFWDRQQRYCLVYNGEIYNFQELRDQLAKSGVEFRTTCDTEVLLEALIKWGPEKTLPKLEGMFAFGFYDHVDKSLLLARDRFGIKPLLVYETENTFLFASEIQAMRPWVDLEPDFLSISGFLYGFSGPTKGFSFFRHVRIVEPGGIVTIKKGSSPRYARFFSLMDFLDRKEMDRLESLSPEAVVNEVDQLLNESVKAQLVADAPVGALCSGGLDSSIIMSIAAKYHNNLAIFHADVVGPVSEYPAALRLAQHLKLDLKAIEVRDQDFIDEIPEVTEHFGHPFYSCPHSLPLMMVCRLIRENGVKAVLSGEASDEYFLGYAFCSPDIRQYAGIRPILRLVKRWFKPPPKNNGMPYLGPSYVQAGEADGLEGLVHALHNRFEVVRDTVETRERLGNGFKAKRYKAPLQSLDLLGYNLRALLHRDDTMGMAASVEARFPFLDTRLAKVAINLPYRHKVRFSWSARDKAHYLFRDKWVARQIAERYMPADLFKRDKKPFPINAYSDARMKIDPAFFEGSFVAELFELGKQEQKILGERAPHWLKWKMMLLDVWAHVCLRNLPKAAMIEKLRKHVTLSNPDYAGFLY
jgi:asparagine synthase (glutamine-hydrolysing)